MKRIFVHTFTIIFALFTLWSCGNPNNPNKEKQSQIDSIQNLTLDSNDLMFILDKIDPIGYHQTKNFRKTNDTYSIEYYRDTTIYYKLKNKDSCKLPYKIVNYICIKCDRNISYSKYARLYEYSDSTFTNWMDKSIFLNEYIYDKKNQIINLICKFGDYDLNNDYKEFYSDVNKDGYNDVVIHTDNMLLVYLGTKESGYQLIESIMLPYSSLMGGYEPADVDMTNNKNGCYLTIETLDSNNEKSASETIIRARFQNNHFYVVGDRIRVWMNDFDEISLSEYRQHGYTPYDGWMTYNISIEDSTVDINLYYKSIVSRNYLTHKEVNEITGKTEKLPNEPLKKLSEYNYNY